MQSTGRSGQRHASDAGWYTREKPAGRPNDKDPPCGGSLHYPDAGRLLAKRIGNTDEGTQFVIIVNDRAVLDFTAINIVTQSGCIHPG